MTDTTTRDALYFDAGPTWNAAAILATETTLADHVLADPEDMHVWIDPADVPIELWGTGTRLLWQLLASIADTSETVSLRAIAGHCDSENRAAVAYAVAVLCGPR